MIIESYNDVAGILTSYTDGHLLYDDTSSESGAEQTDDKPIGEMIDARDRWVKEQKWLHTEPGEKTTLQLEKSITPPVSTTSEYDEDEDSGARLLPEESNRREPELDAETF